MMLLKEEIPLDILSIEAKLVSKMGKSMMKKIQGLLPITKDDITGLFDEASRIIKNKTASEDLEEKQTWGWVSKIYEKTMNNDVVKSNLEELLRRVQGIF